MPISAQITSAQITSICADCARQHGAIWPEWHAATFWPDICQACGQSKMLCDVSDWNWPVGKKPPRFNIANRD